MNFGGIFYIINSPLIISTSNFNIFNAHNNWGFIGGGIYANNIDHCNFTFSILNFTNTKSISESGGALYLKNIATLLVIVEAFELSNNYARKNGGAIYLE